jgi:5-hydroxyisourate hydrolase
MLDFFDAASGEWQQLAASTTDADGRAPGLFPADRPTRAGTYRLTFETAVYFGARKVETFYPKVEIYFIIKETERHYHVPLLLSPFGYSTYRGS